MILRTYSGSRYEILFDTKEFGRLEFTQGKTREFDNDFVEYVDINISPYKAPEQIIGRSIYVTLKSGKIIRTSYVVEIES